VQAKWKRMKLAVQGKIAGSWARIVRIMCTHVSGPDWQDIPKHKTNGS
jgi:hypothetical protein